MKTTKPTTKNTRRTFMPHWSRRRWLITGLVVAAIVAQAVLNGYLLVRDAGRPTSLRIADLIADTAERVGKPAVVEPIGKQVYFPEASMRLPLPADTREIIYDYHETAGAASLNITSSAALDQASGKVRNTGNVAFPSFNLFRPFVADARATEEVFKEVPALQACARGFEVVIGEDDAAAREEHKRIESRRLGDGRTITIYEDTGCPYQPEAMRDYVRQIQSY